MKNKANSQGFLKRGFYGWIPRFNNVVVIQKNGIIKARKKAFKRVYIKK